MDNMTCLFPI